jgi:type IV pilus assembly protein PilB
MSSKGAIGLEAYAARGVLARLVDRLRGDGRLSRDEYESVLRATPRADIGEELVRRGVLGASELVEILSELTGVSPADPAKTEVSDEVRQLVPVKIARGRSVFPLSADATRLELAMVNPLDFHTIQDVEFSTGRCVKPLVATRESIETAINEGYGSDDAAMRGIIERIAEEALEPTEVEIIGEGESDSIDLDGTSVQGAGAPVIRLVNLLIGEALRRDASDIHIEPFEERVRVRFRIDGVLYTVVESAKSIQLPVAARIKIMSRLDIAETRRPQDGRIKLRVSVEGNSRELDLRVSTAPMLWGEKIVMRLLASDKLMLDLSKLGFEPTSRSQFQKAIAKPHGIVLVTGPTGSGKTNTLYSALSTLNKSGVNILTAEDPVEFNLPGINQLPVKESIGVTFASALRTFLRQDPDIILVGEIRDSETADIAVRAALTGHLVLSTLHTNDAPSSVARLVDMGIEPFLLSSSLQLIAAQRLVRRLCVKCRTPHRLDAKHLEEFGLETDQEIGREVYRASGCPDCQGTGYRGRIGLFEVMPITQEIRDVIVAGTTTAEIESLALDSGMLTLRQSGLRKIRDGITSIEEVLSATEDADGSHD